jgi:hypothetical protein
MAAHCAYIYIYIYVYIYCQIYIQVCVCIYICMPGILCIPVVRRLRELFVHTVWVHLAFFLVLINFGVGRVGLLFLKKKKENEQESYLSLQCVIHCVHLQLHDNRGSHLECNVVQPCRVSFMISEEHVDYIPQVPRQILNIRLVFMHSS